MLSHRLLDIYNRLMGHHLGYTILGRIVPATLFALIVTAKLVLLQDLLTSVGSAREGLETLRYYALLGYQGMVIVFLGTVSLLFVVRQPIVKGLSSLRGGIIAIAGSFIATPLAFAPLTVTDPWLIFAASSLMLLGTCLSVLALAHLGRCFGISPQARGLVTSGPYRWIRHPLYISEEITALGMLLPVISPFALAVFVGHCALQFSRARAEENVLESAFPNYHEYRRTVARFVPRLY